MKLRFKVQPYQTAAVQAVGDCFAGQEKRDGVTYQLEPRRSKQHGGKAMVSYKEILHSLAVDAHNVVVAAHVWPIRCAAPPCSARPQRALQDFQGYAGHP